MAQMFTDPPVMPQGQMIQAPQGNSRLAAALAGQSGRPFSLPTSAMNIPLSSLRALMDQKSGMNPTQQPTPGAAQGQGGDSGTQGWLARLFATFNAPGGPGAGSGWGGAGVGGG